MKWALGEWFLVKLAPAVNYGQGGYEIWFCVEVLCGSDMLNDIVVFIYTRCQVSSLSLFLLPISLEGVRMLL